ncbi:alpha-1,4-N-acetylglucosaminyltransferase-like [Oratosquilla oratoria]|uniref:alpha-1,4-N-acetylglucosaminyltransferase-like n=1 Tax=Oratosquilla oratoria TaxID=337810 RepID=UPI003F7673EF
MVAMAYGGVLSLKMQLDKHTRSDNRSKIITNYNDFMKHVIDSDYKRDATQTETQTMSPTSTISLSSWQNILCSKRTRKETFSSPMQKLMPEESGRNIFFVETSCAFSLNAKMACAVESAARHHEDHTVHLLMTSPYINDTNTLIDKLISFPNVRLVAANINEIFKGTPLHDWNQNLTWASNTDWPIYNLSDALRLALVCQYGGIYLDTDILTLAPLPLHKPWIGRKEMSLTSNGGFR